MQELSHFTTNSMQSKHKQTNSKLEQRIRSADLFYRMLILNFFKTISNSPLNVYFGHPVFDAPIHEPILKTRPAFKTRNTLAFGLTLLTYVYFFVAFIDIKYILNQK